MRNLTIIVLIFILSGCMEEKKQLIKLPQESIDTLATQFNPAHLETEDSSDCLPAESEMGSGQECLIPNRTIKQDYLQLIKESLITGINYLPSELPQENKTMEINQEGLTFAEFKWETPIKLKLILYYDGGVTEISFHQNGADLNRAILYSAD